MKLNVTYKKKLTKTAKQKKSDASKKQKGPKLMKDYKDMSEYSIDNATLDLTKMRYGTIEYCDAETLITDDGTIKLSNSWLEVLLIMFYNLIKNYPDKFVDLLVENNVTNMFLCIDKVYGKYSFEKEQYKAYKIFDTDYYLEIIESSDIIFDGIVGLTKCLGIKLDEIKFGVRNKKLRTLNDKFNNVTTSEIIVNINDAYEKFESNLHLVSVDILGEIVNAHMLDVVLIAFCNKIFNEFGIVKLSTLPKYESTGVCYIDDNAKNNPHIMSIKESDVGVYTDGDNIGILNFIRDSMTTLGIDKDAVKFKFKTLQLESELKEWEIG